MSKKSSAPAAAKAGSRRQPTKTAKLAADPLAARLKAANLENRRLKAQLAAARAKLDEMRASADTDFLLDILNRRGFERELNRAIAYIQRYHASGALIMLDVDHLKPINDRFGHAAGDEVLRSVVDVLQHHVRASDIVARLGGDEFVLLLWNLTEADAQAKAEALEAAVDALQFGFAGRTASAGISAGIATLGPGTDARAALAQADRAMYARKAIRHQQRAAAAAITR
ncbi:GGDEF domain-containing protein [Rhodopseudomonas palustris]|uniref:diguanylate cyclase n=1 Tax=Rhodopseudomonas palustris (strain BisB18) TaxID=316056 RepID=Q20ZF1_RHOPB